MAYLDDIPKCALGTACRLKLVTNGDETSAQEASETLETSAEKDCASFEMTGEQFKQLVRHAISSGCRHLDCAPLYETQRLVGEVLAAECKQVPRQDFFITSKVPPNMMRPENLVRSVRASIDELQVNYLDLLLLHAPFATRHIQDNLYYPRDPQTNCVLLDNDEHLLERAWRELATLKRRGFTRYIGLSNVNIKQLDKLNEIEHVDVVQNEYHIYLQNRELFDHCEELDTHFEAYAVFGSPHKARHDGRPNFIHDPIVRRVAETNNLSVGVVNMQWIHKQPLSYVIGCDSGQQWDENKRATQARFSLPLNDLIDLDGLNRNVRIYTFADQHPGLELHCEFPFTWPLETLQPADSDTSSISVTSDEDDNEHEHEHSLANGRGNSSPASPTLRHEESFVENDDDDDNDDLNEEPLLIQTTLYANNQADSQSVDSVTTMTRSSTPNSNVSLNSGRTTPRPTTATIDEVFNLVNHRDT